MAKFEYHKIPTVFKRDPETKFKTLLEGQYSSPELEYLKDTDWVCTEKIDGTNTRIQFGNGLMVFGGKTDNAQIPAPLVMRLQEIFHPIKDSIELLFGNKEICFYGEGYGPKIQNGGKYKDHQDFVLFDIKVGDWWLQRADVVDIAVRLNLDYVPALWVGSLPEMIRLAKGGIPSRWGDFQAEGFVARPNTELCTRNGKRIITKIKCKDFI